MRNEPLNPEERQRELQEEITQWMWNPTKVTKENFGLMIAASFVFSGGNNRRLALYWVYLLKNKLLSRKALDACIGPFGWKTGIFSQNDIQILSAGKKMFRHAQSSFDLDDVASGLYEAYGRLVSMIAKLKAEELNERAQYEGIAYEELVDMRKRLKNMNFSMPVRQYDQELNQLQRWKRIRDQLRNPR